MYFTTLKRIITRNMQNVPRSTTLKSVLLARYEHTFVTKVKKVKIVIYLTSNISVPAL